MMGDKLGQMVTGTKKLGQEPRASSWTAPVLGKNRPIKARFSFFSPSFSSSPLVLRLIFPLSGNQTLGLSGWCSALFSMSRPCFFLKFTQSSRDLQRKAGCWLERCLGPCNPCQACLRPTSPASLRGSPLPTPGLDRVVIFGIGTPIRTAGHVDYSSTLTRFANDLVYIAAPPKKLVGTKRIDLLRFVHTSTVVRHWHAVLGI